MLQNSALVLISKCNCQDLKCMHFSSFFACRKRIAIYSIFIKQYLRDYTCPRAEIYRISLVFCAQCNEMNTGTTRRKLTNLQASKDALNNIYILKMIFRA